MSRGNAAVSVAALALLGIVDVEDDGRDLFTQEKICFTVDDKERVNNGNDSKYLVWTTRADGQDEVFENVDSLILGKFNSSDVYGKLDLGKSFEATVVGWRIPFLSAYRNIVSQPVEVASCGGAAAPAAPAPGQ